METSFSVSIFFVSLFTTMNACAMIKSSDENKPNERQYEMENGRYRTVDEMADYFARLSDEFENEAYRAEKDGDTASEMFLRGKSEAYELAAFEVSHNMRSE